MRRQQAGRKEGEEIGRSATSWTMEPAAGIVAIKSDNSDSSKKFPALVDLMMIPSDPQRIIAARASVVSSR